MCWHHYHKSIFLSEHKLCQRFDKSIFGVNLTSTGLYWWKILREKIINKRGACLN